MQNGKPGSLFEALQGRWALTRRITGADGAALGDFDGLATFAESQGGLAYEERGFLRAGGTVSAAERRYVWRITGTWSADILFEDGRLFHPLDLSHGIAEVTHDCPPDWYAGRYRLAPRRLEIEWDVTGPRKSYRSLTVAQRI